MSWLPNGVAIQGGGGGSSSQAHSISLSADGSTLAFGGPGYDGMAGHVRVYKFIDSAWVQQGAGLNGAAGDEFGISVSLSEDGLTVAIGAAGSNSARGGVRIYTFANGVWGLLGNAINGGETDHELGRSLSLSADGLTLAVSVPGSYIIGSVRVYKLINDTWEQWGNQITNIKPIGSYPDLPVSLSADGYTLAFGTHYAYNTAGYMRVYKFIDGTWVQQGSDINGNTWERLGYSVSLSADGTTVAGGAVMAGSGTGKVRVYKFIDSSTWVQQGGDITGESSGNFSGRSVSLSANGSTVAIGASGNSGINGQSSGHVRVYKLIGGTWIQQGSDIDGIVSELQSGSSVSLSANGNIVATGTIDFEEPIGYVSVYKFIEAESTPVCFLADAPVLTPTGYRPISTLAVGDLVRTAAGRDVRVKRTFAKEYKPSALANPFVIPKGSLGALRALPISPNHEVMVAGRGMVKAKGLGLPRMKMAGLFTYYNLELEDWVRDNLVVAGVECESLAPAERIVMSKAEFSRFVRARYGTVAASRLRLQSVCFEKEDGTVSMPKL